MILLQKFLSKICYQRKNKYKHSYNENTFQALAEIVREVNSLPPNLHLCDENYFLDMIFSKANRGQGLVDFRKSINFYCDVINKFNTQLSRITKFIHIFSWKLKKTSNLRMNFYAS